MMTPTLNARIAVTLRPNCGSLPLLGTEVYGDANAPPGRVRGGAEHGFGFHGKCLHVLRIAAWRTVSMHTYGYSSRIFIIGIPMA